MATILIVEDHAFIRELVEMTIQNWGYDTLSASGADEALLLLRSPRIIDALFTDIYLKTAIFGGCELAHQAIELRPKLGVLYTTGNYVTDKIRALFVEGMHCLRSRTRHISSNTVLKSYSQRNLHSDCAIHGKNSHARYCLLEKKAGQTLLSAASLIGTSPCLSAESGNIGGGSMANRKNVTKARIGIFAGADPVTPHQQAEEAILKAGALQRAIFNSANFSSIATDARGVIQIFNVGAERMLGYTAAEVVNKITPADISDPQEVIARAQALSIELGTPITPGFDALVFKASRGIEDIYELTYIRQDGSRFPAVVSVTALRDAQDAIIGYLLIGTDNTARKLVEAAKKKLDQRLHEANEEIQRFTYIVSHDLRSPLVNIMGFASEIDLWQKQIFERLGALRAQVGGKLDSESDEALRGDIEEALSFIKSSVAKMDRLIAALLKLSREGQRQFQPQLIDMSQLLRSTLEALAYQAQAVNATISIGELPTITSDRLAVEQVFSNLMDNAVKYLRAGVPGSIEVGATESRGAITYEVRDNGRGIDTRDRERIFDLFRRSGVRDRPGDGIGLAHARTLVRRLGGSINVESEPGHGTVFKVTLPKSWPLPVGEMMA